MAFVTSADDDTFPFVELRTVTTRRFQLVEGFGWLDDAGTFTSVPAHPRLDLPFGDPGYNDDTSTDLATVPPMLWGLLASYGAQLYPALLHDAQCVRAITAYDGGRNFAAGWAARSAADAQFGETLRDRGVRAIRRTLFVAGVTVGRYMTYRRPAYLAAMGLAVLGAMILALLNAHLAGSAVGWLVASLPGRGDWTVEAGPWWLWLVGLVAGGVGTALRPADWRLPVCVVLSGALLPPVLLVTWLVSVLLWLPDWVIWSVTGRQGPQPKPAPAIRAPKK